MEHLAERESFSEKLFFLISEIIIFFIFNIFINLNTTDFTYHN